MKRILFLLLLPFLSLKAQLVPPAFTASRILSPKAEVTPSLLVGYGDHGVLVTASGEYATTEFLIYLESVELDIENENEWTISWNSADGETYHLTYMENDFYTVGDDDGKVTMVVWPQSACGGGSEWTHEELVNDFLDNSLRHFVDFYYEAGDKTLSDAFFLIDPMYGIQNSEFEGRWYDYSIMNAITSWEDDLN